MKTFSSQLLAALAAILLVGPAAAQTAVTAKNKSGFKSAPLAPTQMIFDEIVFDDLLVRDVVEFLREEKITAGYNFIVSEEIAEITINLQLRRVTFEQLTKAVEIATGGDVVIEAVSDAGNIYHVRPGPERKPQAEPILRVFNLSRFLAQKSEEEARKALDDVHQTVEIAFDMLANAQRAAGKRLHSRKKVDTKFHPGTKLMIVIGDPADVEVFHEVISQLTGEPRQQKQRSGFGFGGLMGMGGDDAGMDDFGGGVNAARGGNNFGGDFGGGGGGLGVRKQRR